ncbi:MAG: hypothetical protein GY806_11870 [Gammaproteobacteria bacterium]|nr:hypothetical protein [Gammaproteobacteria bacterium]
MASWKDILVDVLTLTDETKKLNKDIERVEALLTNVDRRLIRVETVVDIAALQAGKVLPKGE